MILLRSWIVATGRRLHATTVDDDRLIASIHLRHSKGFIYVGFSDIEMSLEKCTEDEAKIKMEKRLLELGYLIVPNKLRIMI